MFEYSQIRFSWSQKGLLAVYSDDTAEAELSAVKTGGFAFSFPTQDVHSCLLFLVCIGFPWAQFTGCKLGP